MFFLETHLETIIILEFYKIKTSYTRRTELNVAEKKKLLSLEW